MYKLAFFVPASHVEVVKAAVFETARRVMRGSVRQVQPARSIRLPDRQAGQVEVVEEWKVELVVADELIAQAVAALKQSHPYETPAYDVWRLAEF